MDSKRKVNNELVTKNMLSCNRKRKTGVLTIPVLTIPDEVIYLILVSLPADVLYNTMRYVCKLWYNIIKDPRFARDHVLVRSINGVCYYHLEENETIYFAQFGKRKGTQSKLVTLPPRSWFLTSFNGLLLLFNQTSGRLQLANPLTKQLLTLPALDSVSNQNWLNPCGNLILTSPVYSIGFIPSRFQFKLVFTCQCKYGSVRCGVLTLGIDDKWRITDSDTLCKSDKERLLLKAPLYAGNYFHWVRRDADYIADHIISMDLESELFYFSPAPRPVNGDGFCTIHYLARGDSLTCMVGSNNTISWEVFVCLDIIRCKWESFVIDFSPQIRRLRRMVKDVFKPRFSVMLKPIAWIENGEVVIFMPSRPTPPQPPQSLIAYNINTGYAFQFHDINNKFHGVKSFAPSLLSLN